MNYNFVLTSDDGTAETVHEVARGSGSAKVVAALLRAQAEEMDPKPQDPAAKLGEEFGMDLVRGLLGRKSS